MTELGPVIYDFWQMLRLAWKGGMDAWAEPAHDDSKLQSHQYTTTERIDLPSCMRSKAVLISSSFKVWVMRSSMLILPSIYQSTIFGTSVRPLAPPKAVPFQTRPVTSWKGRVLIS